MPDLARCVFCGEQRGPQERVVAHTLDGVLVAFCNPACEALKARLRELGRPA